MRVSSLISLVFLEHPQLGFFIITIVIVLLIIILGPMKDLYLLILLMYIKTSRH